MKLTKQQIKDEFKQLLENTPVYVPEAVEPESILLKNDLPSTVAAMFEEHSGGSLLHDVYYQMMRESCILRNAWRAYADRQYREICLDAGMWEPMAEWRYWAIDKFAGKHTYPQPQKRAKRSPVMPVHGNQTKVYRVVSGYGKTRRTVMKAACLMLAVCLMLGLAGCPGRTITYTDPNGYQIKYNSNLASSTQAAGTVLVRTPNGWLILVSDVKLNADDLKLWVVPYGGAQTTDK